MSRRRTPVRLPEPPRDGVWIFRTRCGCVFGAMNNTAGWGSFRAGMEFYEDASRADDAKRRGVTWELVSDEQYRADTALSPVGCHHSAVAR